MELNTGFAAVTVLPARSGHSGPRTPVNDLKADWLDERPTSNGAVWERVGREAGGFGADSQPHGQSGSRGMTSCLPARREEVVAPPPDHPLHHLRDSGHAIARA